MPIEGIAVAGPFLLQPGEEGLYTATAAPLTATVPIAFAWDNGALGPTAVYSWSAPGVYTASVVAANACSTVNATFAVMVPCQPIESVTIDGPSGRQVGETGWYTAAWVPLTATLPVTLTWNNGAGGSTAAYSWTLPGMYTVSITAVNACSAVGTHRAVTVPCQPVESIEVSGPGSLLVGEMGRYTATYAPLTATLPLTVTWDNGMVGPTAAYSWTLPGTYVLVVTASNGCGQAVGNWTVRVAGVEGYRIYLPLIIR